MALASILSGVDQWTERFWMDAIGEAYASDLIDLDEMASLLDDVLYGRTPDHRSLPAYAPLPLGMGTRGERR